MFGDGPLGREICGDEAGIRALPAATHPRLLADDLPAGQHGRRGRRRPRPRRGASSSRRRRSGPATASMPGFAPAPTLPAGPRGPDRHAATPRQAQLCLGVPALQRDHPDSLDARRAQRGPRRRDEQPARSCRSREELGLAYDVVVRASSTTPTPAPSRSRPASIRTSLPAALEAILRGARPAARRARPGRGAGQGEGATCPAGSSCGWTTPATSPRGSAARRRSTTGS